MNNFFKIVKKVLTIVDYFYLAIIVFSFIIAIFVEDGSWQLILISVGILFLVAFISSVAQKFTEYYENVPRSAFTSNFDYQVTTQNSNIGTRQTIENFDKTDEFSEITSKPNPEVNETQTSTIQSFTGNTFDEEFSGVRIIKRKKEEGSGFPTNDDNESDSESNEFKIRQIQLNLEENPTYINQNSPATPYRIFEDSKKELSLESQINFERNAENLDKDEKSSEHSLEMPLFDDLMNNQDEKKQVTDIILEEVNQSLNCEKLLLDVPINTFFENHPIFGDEPKYELEYFISRILMIIKNTVDANTIALFMVDSANSSLKLFSYVTENEEYITKNYSIPFGNDILTEIINFAKPEILSEINYASVTDILPYYNQLIEIKSFAGIPIFQKEQVIGVLTLDSFENNTFNSNVIGYIGNLTKLLSSLLTSLNEKFELMVSSKTLDAITKFRSILKDDNISFDFILQASFDTISEILGFENIGFCNFSSSSSSWQIQAIKGTESFVNTFKNLKIENHKALITKTLFNKEPLFFAPINNIEYILSADENFNKEGYFVSVPLKSLNSSYGAIFVYGDNHLNISPYDVKILILLGEQIASTIEKYLYINVFHKYSHIDTIFGIYNPSAFYQRLTEEMSRAKDYNFLVNFISLQIDNIANYKEIPGLDESLMKLVIKILKAHIRKYDLIGQIDDNIIGVVLIGITANEARIWAERLRNEIANKYIIHDDKRFMITLSIGLASSNEEDSIETLTKKTLEMLKSSSRKTNTLSIY